VISAWKILHCKGKVGLLHCFNPEDLRLQVPQKWYLPNKLQMSYPRKDNKEFLSITASYDMTLQKIF
jgi:hypothetical protein